MMLRFVCVAVAVAVSLSADPGKADTTPCIEVSTAAEFDAIRLQTFGYFCLTKDINLGSLGNFYPIGHIDIPFEGTLDGRGFRVRNMTINVNGGHAGLFGVMKGRVRNVVLENARVTTNNQFARVGTLVGHLTDGGVVSNSSATGSVQSLAANTFAGGLVGYADLGASVVSSFTTASVSVPLEDGRAGGLVGQTRQAFIVDSYATGSVDAPNGRAGGLVGTHDNGLIARSFATGRASAPVAGGLVAYNFGRIENCYATGRVIGGSGAGGLVARGSGSDVYSSYATGRVSAEPGAVEFGGLIGSQESTVVEDSYWDRQTTRQQTSDGGTSRTTAQLTANLPNGFKATIWSIEPGETYPYLTNVTPASRLPKP
jgi:hypothetical protein